MPQLVKFNDEIFEFISYEEFEKILTDGCPIKALDNENLDEISE